MLGDPFPVEYEGKRCMFSKRSSEVHGVGLFAEEPIRAGQIIGFFTGERLSRKGAARRRLQGGKSLVEFDMGDEGRMYLDASRGKASPFQWINSVAGSATLPNVQFVVVGERLCVETIVAVSAGDELLANYDYGGGKVAHHPFYCSSD